MRASPDAVRLLYPESGVFQHTEESLKELGDRLGQAYRLEASRIVRRRLLSRVLLEHETIVDGETGDQVPVVYLGGMCVLVQDLCAFLRVPSFTAQELSL